MPSRFRTRSSRGKTTSRAIRPLAFFAFLLISAIAAATALADYAQVGSYSDVQEPRKAAVEASTGNLFVVDAAADQVKVLAPDGNSLSDLATFGAGALDDPYGIAIDESGSTSAIYVSSQSNGGEIVKFTSDGEATPSFSTDPTFTSPTAGNASDQIGDFRAALALAPNGDLWVADPGNNLIKRFDSSGAHIGGSNIDGSTSGTAFEGLMDIATDSTGDLLVVDSNGDVATQGGISRVERFTADGSHEATIGPVGPNQRPASIAVNDDDQVIVSGEQDAVYRDESPVVQVYGPDGTLLEEPALEGVKFTTIQGIAASGLKAYAIHDVGTYGTTPYGSPAIKVLRLIFPPVVSIDPIDPEDITSTSVVVSGTVNPNGLPTDYAFEYRTRSNAPWSGPDPVSAGTGTSAVATGEVELEVPANKRVSIRLRAINADGERTSEPLVIETPGSAPFVSTEAARNIDSTSALLRGKLAANNEMTRYWFEYGTTSEYGAQAPANGANAGLGESNVSRQLSGLQPGTTYHYRLVAENATGRSEGADQIFTTLLEGKPVRGYELVSPVQKFGSDVTVGLSRTQASIDGDSVVYASPAAFAGAAGTNTAVDYIARRGEDGRWSTEPLTPPQASNDARPFAGVNYLHTHSPDLQHGLLMQGTPGLVDGAPEGQLSAYRQDRTEPGELSYDLLTPTGAASPSLFMEWPFARDAVDDFSKVLFESNTAQTPDAPNDVKSLYLWDEGEISAIGILPDGTVAQNGSMASQGASSSNGPTIASNSISDNGELVTFVTPTDWTAPTQIYQHEVGGDTVHVSAPQRPDSGPDPAGTQNARFMDASGDGNRIFFVSGEKLTENSTAQPGGYYNGELYMYERESGTLTDLTVSSSGSGAQVVGVVDASEDGKTVYFVANERPDEATGGNSSLYVWHEDQGGTTSIRAIGDELNPDGNYNTYEYLVERAYVWTGNHDLYSKATPDGGAVVFTLDKALTQGAVDGVRSSYHYDLETDELTCMSCPTDGSEQGEDSTQATLATLVQITAYKSRLVSDDGSRATFQTSERLLSEDSNGVQDVYLWEEGEIELVSSGADPSPSYLGDISATGDDIFFLTRERISDRDVDSHLDVYDYRVGGGEREVLEERPCEGDGCMSPVDPAPAFEEPATDGASQGNPPEVADCSGLSRTVKSLRKRARTMKKKAANAGAKRRAALKKRSRLLKRKAQRIQKRVNVCERGGDR